MLKFFPQKLKSLNSRQPQDWSLSNDSVVSAPKSRSSIQNKEAPKTQPRVEAPVAVNAKGAEITRVEKPEVKAHNTHEVFVDTNVTRADITQEQDLSKSDPKVVSSSSKQTTPTANSTPHMAESQTKNILSKDVEIKGDISFTNELIIDGKVEGEISSEGILTVGENAQIVGNVRTKCITVLGRMQGNITVTDRCELKARAHFQGDLSAGRLSIEEGATFIGKSEVNNTGAAAPISSKAAAPVSIPQRSVTPATSTPNAGHSSSHGSASSGNGEAPRAESNGARATAAARS